jgi:hypothetical protein
MGIYANPKFENVTGEKSVDKTIWFKKHGQVIPEISEYIIHLEYKDALKNHKHLVCLYYGGEWVGAAVIMLESDITTWVGDPRVVGWVVLDDALLSTIVEDEYKRLFATKKGNI